METDRISSATESPDGTTKELAITQTLGTLQLRHVDTNQIILIPTPSSDPADPLNWSQARKYYITGLVSFLQFLGGFAFSAPAVQIIALANEYGDGNPKHLTQNIAAVAYFISGANLAQGVGNMLWMPVVNKYGRRVVYVVSWSMCLGMLVWSSLATSYASQLAARILMGFTAGASECVGPLTVGEIFFLHERGKMMSFVIFSLVIGTNCGLLLGGLITIRLPWQYINWVLMPFVALTLLLVIFTFPETYYKRDIYARKETIGHRLKVDRESGKTQIENRHEGIPAPGVTERPATWTQSSYWRGLSLIHGPYTQESLVKMTFRPLLGLFLPPIFWASCTMGINIGFIVIISSNQAASFSQVYGFSGYQSGLCWIAGVLGSAIGILGGGPFSDVVADFFTKRNGGVREPEMRLPAMILPGIGGPLSLILYGFGIHYGWHWMAPTLGLSFLCFSVVSSATISTTYTVDCYRPIAGETVVTKMVFKAVLAFILAAYATNWIANLGHRSAFGTMAGIYVFVFLLAIPLFFGKAIRPASMKWRITRYLHWNEDRETGE